MSVPSKRLSSALIAVLAAVGFTGCSDLSATVKGTVFLDGKPLSVTDSQRGTVVFRPVAGGPTCTGLIGSAGEYNISTGSENGLAPGDYLVSVQVVESQPPRGGSDAPTGKPITPAVYSDPLTSRLNLMVRSGSNRHDIELDSSAGPAVLPVEAEPETDSGDAAPAEPSSEEDGTTAAEPMDAEADAPSEPEAAPADAQPEAVESPEAETTAEGGPK